jgi:hypothetical protein
VHVSSPITYPRLTSLISSDNRALSKLFFGGDDSKKWSRDKGEETITHKPAVLEVGMIGADFSNKNLGAGGGIITVAWITHKDNGALLSLNLAKNNLGELVPPEGWTQCTDWNGALQVGSAGWYKHADGQEQKAPPAGAKPEGIIAFANAVPDMRAMTSLNLASNSLGIEGAKIIAAFLPKCT